MKMRWAVDKLLSPYLGKPIKIGCGVDFGKTLIIKIKVRK